MSIYIFEKKVNIPIKQTEVQPIEGYINYHQTELKFQTNTEHINLAKQ